MGSIVGFDLVDSSRAAEVRALRPPRPVLDPWRPQGVTVELERAPGGELRPSATVFLTGAECPFTCVFCDLWRYTVDGPTPKGALPAQLRSALKSLPGLLSEAGLDRCDRLKLYNASNFFEPRAVPEADLEPIARLADGFERVIVECHPRLVDERVRRFADRLQGRLEVAMGLETVHPQALPRLGKQLTLDQFDRAASRLVADGVDLRAFVLVGVPFVPAAEQAHWAAASVRHAAAAGARSVALIPVRGGNGELERLERLGEFQPPGTWPWLRSRWRWGLRSPLRGGALPAGRKTRVTWRQSRSTRGTSNASLRRAAPAGLPALRRSGR